MVLLGSSKAAVRQVVGVIERKAPVAMHTCVYTCNGVSDSEVRCMSVCVFGGCTVQVVPCRVACRSCCAMNWWPLLQRVHARAAHAHASTQATQVGLKLAVPRLW